MSVPSESTHRELRNRPGEITGAAPGGQSFSAASDGHPIGQFPPLRRRRRFVSSQEFAAMSRTTPAIDLNAFRADQNATADAYLSVPCAR